MKKLIALSLMCLLLSACFGGGAEIPQNNFYRLADIAAAGPKFDVPLFSVMAVSSLRSDALHKERAILYSDRAMPLRLLRYHYHHWTQVPNQLIQQNLIDYLRATGIAKRVIRYGDETNIDANITGYIRKFERILDKGKVSVNVELELQLETFAAPRRHIQFVASERQIAQDDSMHATVRAFGEALQKIFQQFVAKIPGDSAPAIKDPDIKD